MKQLLNRIIKAALLLFFSITVALGQGDFRISKKRVSKKREYKCHHIGKQKHQSRKFSKREVKKIIAKNAERSSQIIVVDTLPVIKENKEELFASLSTAELKIVDTKVENKINLPLPQPVYFRFDTDDLTYEDLYQIYLAIEHLKLGKSLIIEGHTDSFGSDEYNKALSLKRAIKIKGMIIDLGQIAEEAIIIKHYGEEKPAVDNDTYDNRQLNRRVEFIVL